MNGRMVTGLVIVSLWGSNWVLGQNPGWEGANQPASQAAQLDQQPVPYPDQPVVPQDPRLERRPDPVPNGPPQPPPAPFALTPVEEAQLDRVLMFWEKSSLNVKTFRAKFTRLEYNPVWGPPDKPIAKDAGEVRYSAPDKGSYSVEGPRPERWIYDGKSIYEYDYQQKLVVEHRLPPQVQGKAITDGPIPFLFGAKAEQLKRRYYLRITTPADRQGEIWLEAFPKSIQDAQNFKRAELILAAAQNELQPAAVQVHHPNGQGRTVYIFESPVINQRELRVIFEDPFHARVPAGWKTRVEDAPQVPNATDRLAPGNVPAAMGNRRATPR